MSELQLHNGNWQQTIAFYLSEINNLLDNTQCSGTPITQDIILIENFISKPDIKYVITNAAPLPITTTITYKKKKITPATIIVNLTNSDLKKKCCGCYTSNQDIYVECFKRVDKAIADGMNYIHMTSESIGLGKIRKEKALLKKLKSKNRTLSVRY